jgi:hypothetical protein
MPTRLAAGVAAVLAQSPAPSTVAMRELAKCRAIVAANVPKAASPQARWLSIPLETRLVLVTVATARPDVERTAAMPWHQFTDAERERLGAMARAMVRGLRDAADWLH